MLKPILLEIPEQFETERLLISNYEKGDGEEFYQLLQSNFNHLQEEVDDTKTLKTVEDAEEYVRSKQIAWLSRERLVPKIVKTTRGRMIGQLWIEPRWDRMIFEIGYFIEEKSQGNGYITEAVRKMIEYLFTELDANRLEIHCKATNARSIGVAKRCGFTKEAHLRERGRTNEGEIVDMVIYGLLRSEFPRDNS
jgi:ribosomal-protein-serine acetyltransferase